MESTHLAGLRIRSSVRALVLDPHDRVLLVRFVFPAPAGDADGDGTMSVWATPGGGQEPGEDDAATLGRELDEELGLDTAGSTPFDPCADRRRAAPGGRPPAVEIGPQVWSRVHVIPFLDGKWDGQRDRIYLVRTHAFEPAPRLGWDRLRAERVHELRWWTLTELQAATGVRFAPRRLPQLLADVVAGLATGRLPHTPIDTGV